MKNGYMIGVVLPSGKRVEYYPPHRPVNKQFGDVINFWWETDEGEIFTLTVQTGQIALMEQVSSGSAVDEGIMEVIEEAKAVSGSP